MELYLFFAFLLFYMITAFLLDEKTKEKIWLIAFIVSFLATSMAIAFIKMGRQDVMMNAEQLNWYYFLYLFGIISVVLGLFNLWIYRKAVWSTIFNKDE
ncbi:MAG: hypothetical protein E7020_01105 [Alphaproteobacteria bacterium]|nr:hypothetical protein [Alphaproteobacteria bacterium]